MNEAGESGTELQRMRARVRELEADAERTADADKKHQLRQEANRLNFNCEQKSMLAAGDIYPCE